MPDHLENLAADFFKRFACCEFALKDGGFHKGINKAAQADWEKFALSIEGVLSERALNRSEENEVKEAVEFLLNAPPKKQYIDNYGNLEWRVVEPTHTSRADLILLYVRRVRNNLFHGGKVGSDWNDPGRNELLIKHSILILNACFRSAVSNVSDRYFAHFPEES